MRTIFLALISVGLLMAVPATAQPVLPDGETVPEAEVLTPDSEALTPQADDVPAAPDASAQSRLDTLFDDLKRAANPKHAASIANEIWTEWFRSGSATVDLMLHWSNAAIERKDFNIALDFLDQIVTRQPDFAEGWNRRATLHFNMNNFAKSMSDIQKVLELEPRHFGALSGMAVILEQTGRKQAALDAWQRMLAIYPANDSAQKAVIRLSEELAGRRA